VDFSDINGRYKQIKGFEDYYITEYGEVYSMKQCGKRYEGSKLHKMKNKDPNNKAKYLNIILSKNGKPYTFSIHRLVAEYFVDGYFDGAVVNHIDGNNRNNVASNLEWVTVRENVVKSYGTSGINAKRNCKIWELYNEDGVMIGAFEGHPDMEDYIKLNGINASPTQLTKNGHSRGYTIRKR